MKKKTMCIPETRLLRVNNSREAESLETILRKNKQGAGIELLGTKPLLYNLRKDGVIPEANIKHDKWNDAQTAHDSIARLMATKRAEFDKKIENPNTESTAGTGGDAA